MNKAVKKPVPARAKKRLALIGITLLFYSFTTNITAVNAAGENKMSEQINGKALAISVEAEAKYILGFPVIIALTIRNETTDTDFYDLPKLDMLSPIDSIAVDIQSPFAGSTLRLGPSFLFREKNLFRTELMVGQTKRMLVDLTWFGQTFSPGQYHLTVTLFAGPDDTPISAPVLVEFIEPTAAEYAEATRLRQLGLKPKQVDYGSWQPFLSQYKNTATVSKSISEQASQQIALYLMLNRAAYSQEPLVRYPVSVFRKNWGPVLSAEIATYEYEIALARGNQMDVDDIRSRFLQAWPDLSKQLNLINKGDGILGKIRKNYGIENTP